MTPPRAIARAAAILVGSDLAHKLDLRRVLPTPTPGKSGFTDNFVGGYAASQLKSALLMRYQLHGVAASIARAGSPRRRKIVLALVLFWQCVSSGRSGRVCVENKRALRATAAQ